MAKIVKDYRCEQCDQYPLRIELEEVAPDSMVKMNLSWKCRKCGNLNRILTTIKGDPSCQKTSATKIVEKGV